MYLLFCLLCVVYVFQFFKFIPRLSALPFVLRVYFSREKKKQKLEKKRVNRFDITVRNTVLSPRSLLPVSNVGRFHLLISPFLSKQSLP